MIDLTKFREDFNAIFRAERMNGHSSEDDAKRMRAEAGLAVQEHMGDEEWMRNAAEHFAGMAADIRGDLARSARIREEVRAEKARRAAA